MGSRQDKRRDALVPGDIVYHVNRGRDRFGVVLSTGAFDEPYMQWPDVWWPDTLRINVHPMSNLVKVG